MRLWRALVGGLRALVCRNDTDRDLSDELRHFMEEAEADLISRGVGRAEARRTVRLSYGDPLQAREDVRDYGWEAWVETLFSDLRLALRNLRRGWRFTGVVVLTLGLGVGATVAVFGAVHPILFEPLAYPGSERLVFVADRGQDGQPIRVTFGTYRELVQRSEAFDVLAVFKPWQPTLTGGDEPARLEGQAVTATYFQVLGTAPALGPGFDPTQDRPGGAREVILADGLWRERYGADPQVIGRVVRLDGEPATIVGVMPERFENVTLPAARLWTLLQYDPRQPAFDTREWGHHLDMIGRLRPGIGVDEARSYLDGIARSPIAAMPRPSWAALDGGFSVRALKEAVTADVASAMWILLGAVSLLGAVTCANLTIVVLARGSERRSEFAMRLALGASRRRLARYLVTEGLLLAGLGGALGVAVARLGFASLIAAAPPSLPRAAAAQLTGSALLLGIVVTALAGLAFGLAPGLHRAKATTTEIQAAGRGSVRRSRATRKGLVVAEVAVATVLLIGAGLLLRSAHRLFSQPLGLDPSDVVVMQVYATGLERGDRATHRFFDEALEAVRSVPGVANVAMTSQLPLSGDSDRYGVTPVDADVSAGMLGDAERYGVTPAYFATMSVPVVAGRAIDEGDVAGAPRAAVLSRSLAGRLFPDREPLGSEILVGDPELEPYTVVGIVQDVKHRSLADGPSDVVYVATHQWHWADRVRWFVVESDAGPAQLVPAIRRAIWSVDGDQPVVRAQQMRELVSRSEVRRRFVLILLTAFAGSALAVTVVGLFGVLAGVVTERTQELGIRAALGASCPIIVSMVLRQGLGLAAVGAAVGITVSIMLSGALSSLLFQITRHDPLTYVSVVVILGVGAAIASVVPALRAGRADPADALRSE